MSHDEHRERQRTPEIIIIGQGLSGSALAWQLHWAGRTILLIDRGETGTASRIAAGLMTPITGRRMTMAEDFESQRTAAEAFYRSVEAETGKSLLETTPAVRLFASDEERSQFLKERRTRYEKEVRLIRSKTGEVTGFEMLRAGRLRVAEYLDATASSFRERNEFVTAAIDPASDIELIEDGVRIAKLEVSAAALVFCQGYQPDDNPWFPGLPDGASRGEILKVRLRGRNDRRVTHQGVWLAPDHAVPDQTRVENQHEAPASDEHAGHAQSRPLSSAELTDTSDVFIVGATYDRAELSNTTTAEGRRELLNGLSRIAAEPAEVLDQFAAVRAGMKHRRPVFRLHHKHRQLAILNGLGSRGALLAPTAAKALTELLFAGRTADADRPAASHYSKETTETVKTSRPACRKSLTQLAHSIIRRVLKPGDAAIDATAGNGYDTLFLAQQAGETGTVISIDVQESAVSATQERLARHGLHHVSCRQADHSREIVRLTAEHFTANAIMFNLGYLPGSDRVVTTAAESTILALHAAQMILSPGGVMTIIAYRGHKGGKEEAEAIEEFVLAQKSAEITVERIDGDDQDETSPILFIWRRRQSMRSRLPPAEAHPEPAAQYRFGNDSDGAEGESAEDR